MISVFLVLATAAPGPVQVNVTPDLDYVPSVDYANGKDRLDIYAPAGASKAPVVLMFHGGGLTEGDRKDERRFAERLAQSGYVVVTASYRLSPRALHPAHIEDAAAAFSWVKRNIAGWGGDARSVFVAGYSAGAYLAALLGTDSRYLVAHGLSTGDIAGLVLIAATFDLQNRPEELKSPWGKDPRVWAEASPVRYFGPHVPPSLLVIGTQDERWRLEDHRAAVAAARAAGHANLTFRLIPGRNHTTIRRTAEEDQAEETIVEILAFLQRTSGTRRPPGSAMDWQEFRSYRSRCSKLNCIPTPPTTRLTIFRTRRTN